MPRQKKSASLLVPVMQLGLLILLACVFIPGLRGLITLIGFASIAVVALLLISKKFGRAGEVDSALAESFNSWPSHWSTALGRLNTSSRQQVLIARLHAIDWFQFERLIGVVYEKQGYSVTRLGGARPDGGVDLVIEKGDVKTLIQCKHWKSWQVGVRHIRELLGSLTDAGVSKAVLITLRGYTSEARALAEKHGITLMEESDVLQLLQRIDAPYDPSIQPFLDDSRKTCPRCENEMVLRRASKGRHEGKEFWGCSTFPRCRYTFAV